MADCYSGPNPVEDKDRMAIWKWAKANGIDQGMPFDKVHDAINTHFFGGQAKPEWITDILSGRKTPFRAVADGAWKAQYNRRQIVQQAQAISKQQAMGPVSRMFNTVLAVPRDIATLGHAVVFPVSHAGDLAFRPASWATFMRGVFNTYSGAYNPAFHERIMNNMQRQPRYEMAIRSGLDVGPKSYASGLISRIGGRSSERAWDMLTTMRYDLWDRQMQKFLKPEMTKEEQVELGKNLADWANHATGSAKSVPYIGNLMFGPKLTASKVTRLFADPAKTLNTFANWKNATTGEKAAAWTRLSGATQYATSLLGFLAANQGLNMALGTGQNVNFNDPTKSDWLQFKMGGMEGYLPGLHSELRTLGQILATSWATPKQLRGQTKEQALGGIVGQYILGKATPAIGLGQQLLMGQNWQGRPMPWSSSPGTINKKTGAITKPRLSWGEFAGSMAPIPLQGPIGYVYDKLKQGGASALDATAIIKGLIISGLGATGVHIKEEPSPKPPSLTKQQRVAAGL